MKKPDYTMHLRMSEEDLARLDEVAGHMRKDPLLGAVLGEMKVQIGRSKAIRYAIAKYLEQAGEG